MENIDQIGKNSLEALSRDNLTERNKRRLGREIFSGAVALICLVTGLIFSLVYPDKDVVPALIYTVGVLVEGIPVAVAAVKGILTKDLTNAMEILVTIAIIACYFTGSLQLAILIPLILNLAHFFEERSIMGGRDVIEGLRQMQQDTAILLSEDGSEQKVEAKALKKGQLILVKPGAGIPIDGVVVEGETNIDQKSLTGEPQPAHAAAGDSVFAGTVNLDGQITVRVEKEYVDTSFANILNLLEKSEGIAAPESRLIDQFMRYYIPLILALAAGVALVTRDVSKAIAILVVSCPCGQMLVSSAPMIAALSAATKRGILIKNSKFIEEMTAVDTVVFDKTGTVTEGKMTLSGVLPAAGVSGEELLAVAMSVASASTHPISRAVMIVGGGAAYEKGLTVKEISGKGMEGTGNGVRVLFGNREWMIAEGVTPPDESAEGAVGSVSYVAKNGVCLGALVFSDQPRAEAKGAIDELRSLGVEHTVMLTGDREAAARHVCDEVGVETLYAKLLPEEKLSHLKELKENHCVLAVGDGINDALALKEAHVGIAMGAMGSDLAIQSADIALMNNNLENIPFSLRLARRTKRIIYQNLGLSIGISAFMIGLSSVGVISALAGSVLHNFGAFAVLINSSRILKTK